MPIGIDKTSRLYYIQYNKKLNNSKILKKAHPAKAGAAKLQGLYGEIRRDSQLPIISDLVNYWLSENGQLFCDH